MSPSLPSASSAPVCASSRKSSGSYHHGDLRLALIAAARESLETTASESITLKSLASQLGVSQPAPYRHFESREALLVAVAADGFARFREALVVAAAGAPEEEQFERSALAYLAFGCANMGVYRLMFASRCLRSADDETLAAASKASFAFLLDKVARYAPPDRLHSTAIWVWSTLHGMVMLAAEGLAAGPIGEPVSPAQVIRQMVESVAKLRSSGKDLER